MSPTKANDGNKETFGDEDADLSKWERIEVGIGEKLDFEATPLFIGTYRGRTTVTREGDGEVCPALLFTDTAGNECFAWQTFQLDKAMASCTEGDTVRIEFTGKTKKADGNPVSNYRVYRKPAEATA